MNRSFLIYSSLCLLLLSGCMHSVDLLHPDKITSINIIDRNGLSETISSKERLTNFDKTDFLSPQPYQKVMRVYGREQDGGVRSCITSYHPNGQIKQYLDALNNRAFGTYREWFPNGQLKVETHIIGGIADLNTQAEESWLFEGKNQAWDDEGNLIAEIFYNKGELAEEFFYYEDGTLLQKSDYECGQKHGASTRYWTPNRTAAEELYNKGLLKTGKYFTAEGEVISEIVEGKGIRPLFENERVIELQEFKAGIQEGKVQTFDVSGSLVSEYFIVHGEKEGEEVYFYPQTAQRHLVLNWSEGVLQGTIKTWYENGCLESQREMNSNQKNGLLTAWYKNGALMLVEEYGDDKLIKGEYYRMGEHTPVSKIEKGKGIATLFTEGGNFFKKITYDEGVPVE